MTLLPAYGPVTLTLLGVLAMGCGVVFGLGGPGGTVIVAGLFALLALPPGALAGTAAGALVVLFVAGSGVYARSGDVDWRVTLLLVPTGLVGTQVGILLNAHVSKRAFSLFFGAFVLLVGVALLYRELRGTDAVRDVGTRTMSGMAVFGGIGFGVGVVGGLTGLGGPAITVPALIVLDVPLLEAIGTGQVLGAAVTAGTTVAYLQRGLVHVSTALLLAPPLVAGLICGWYLVHRVDDRWLKLGIGTLLVLLVPYFLL